MGPRFSIFGKDQEKYHALMAVTTCLEFMTFSTNLT